MIAKPRTLSEKVNRKANQAIVLGLGMVAAGAITKAVIRHTDTGQAIKARVDKLLNLEVDEKSLYGRVSRRLGISVLAANTEAPAVFVRDGNTYRDDLRRLSTRIRGAGRKGILKLAGTVPPAMLSDKIQPSAAEYKKKDIRYKLLNTLTRTAADQGAPFYQDRPAAKLSPADRDALVAKAEAGQEARHLLIRGNMEEDQAELNAYFDGAESRAHALNNLPSWVSSKDLRDETGSITNPTFIKILMTGSFAIERTENGDTWANRSWQLLKAEDGTLLPCARVTTFDASALEYPGLTQPQPQEISEELILFPNLEFPVPTAPVA